MLISPAAEEWPQQGIEEGREEGKRQLLIELLAYRFRPPDADLLAALGACTLEQLSVVSRMILDAGSAAKVRQRAHALLAR